MIKPNNTKDLCGSEQVLYPQPEIYCTIYDAYKLQILDSLKSLKNY